MLSSLKPAAILALSISISFPATAQTILPNGDPAVDDPFLANTPAFVPPPNRTRRPGNRGLTGTRQDSCVGNAETAFTILAPRSYVGVSIAQQPSFSWYLPEAEEDYLVDLIFYLPGEDGELIEVTLPYQSGINTHTLPLDTLLTPGENYLWQVTVRCNENRPSNDLLEESWIEVGVPDARLLNSLEQATTEAEKALVYGQAGFWYDAIAQVYQSDDPAAIAVRHQLLQDLAAMEEDEALRDNILNIVQRESQE